MPTRRHLTRDHEFVVCGVWCMVYVWCVFLVSGAWCGAQGSGVKRLRRIFK